MKLLAILGVAIILDPLLVIWNGYVLSIIWGWFMVAAFNLPALSIPEAIGLSLIVSYLTHQEETEQKEKEYPLIRAIVMPLVKGGFALLIGAIVKGFL